jgi:hypothetical protein
MRSRAVVAFSTSDTGKAYWLLEESALAQRYEKVKGVQRWKLKVIPTARRCRLATTGNGNIVPQGRRVHGVSAAGDRTVLHQQHHVLAERKVTRGNRRPL